MGLLDLRNEIMADLDTGMGREEAFHRRVSAHPQDASKIAFAIASVPKEEMRARYLRLNSVLFLILVGVSIMGFLQELPIDFQQSTIFIFLRIGLPLVFSYFVYHFHGGIYRLLGFWCLFDLLEWFLLAKFVTLFGLIKLILLVLAIVLSFFIAFKVFPNLRLLGPKTDAHGRYLL